MKKTLAIIFSLYILALSVMPCADTSDCKYKSEQTLAKTSTNHTDHENDSENCPPFCVCACCGQTCSVAFLQSFSLFNLPLLQQKFSSYTSAFFSEVFISIWQPPKLS